MPERISHSAPRLKRAHTALLAACALVGAVQRIAILRLDPREMLARYGSDDMFYYTEVARHFALGRALSFDGVHPTSGVQPLWLALLVPWARLFEGWPALALRVDLALVTVVTLVSGWLMPRLVRTVMALRPLDAAVTDGQVGALGTLAGCIWLVHPRVLSVTFEGTEGALAALCWQVSIMAWAAERSASRSFRLGVALGMGTLARIDHLALLGAFLVWPRGQRRSLRRAVFLILPVAALWGSWLMFCRLTTGSFLQDSGMAKRVAHERYDTLDLPAALGNWTTFSRPLQFLAKGIWTVVQVLFHAGSHTSRFSFVAMLVMALSLAIATGSATKRRIGTGALTSPFREAIMETVPTTVATCRAFGPVFVTAASVLLAYVVVLQHLRTWYAMPALLSSTLIASALCLDTTRNARGTLDISERPRLLVLTCALWLAGAWTEQIATRTRSWLPSYYATARVLVAVTPATARIGAFNAGIVGAFASEGSRRVINLDGVVNHSALRAIELRTLTDYIYGEQIEFIADYPRAISVEEKIAAPGLQANLELVETVALEDRPGETLGIWRVRTRR
jgi:hypothetical protein